MRQKTLELVAGTHPIPAISGRAPHLRFFSLLASMVLGLVTLIPVAWGQDMVLGYTGAMGGSGEDYAISIAVDGADNIYSTGSFEGTVDFDPGPGVFNLTSAGLGDAYVCKLDASGAFQWAKAMGGISTDGGRSIEVDDAGNVYCTGQFSSTADFDPGPGVFNINSAGDGDIFVCKLGASGAFQWAGAMGGPGLDTGGGIVVDGAGGVYGTGYFEGTADFDPGPGAFNLTSAGGLDAFILKLEPQSLPMAGNDIGACNADQLLTTLTSPPSVSVLANDTDANTMDTLTVTAHDATSVLGAAVLVNPDGTFVYDPTAVAALQALAAADSMVDSFTYTVSDGTDTAVGTVTITVYGAGTMLPALTLWGVCLLCLALAGAGIRARQVSQQSNQ
jgi:VCBS repeat-containing protein